jgi:hypothetical protein
MAKRVFFSFHYQDVIDFRANVVRQHWVTKPDRESAGFFDASIWESAKTTGPVAVKRLVNAALDGTSVTAVLIGSQTYERPWVRYEVMKSFRRGSSLVGVHINSITGKDKKTKLRGPNPLLYLGVTYSESGLTATLWEKRDEKWVHYTQIDDTATYQTGGVRDALKGKGFNLTAFYPEYDWIDNDGYNNFSGWVQ